MEQDNNSKKGLSEKNTLKDTPDRYLHAVQLLQKRERHASSDDHFVHFVQHVLNQLNFILDLGTSENG